MNEFTKAEVIDLLFCTVLAADVSCNDDLAKRHLKLHRKIKSMLDIYCDEKEKNEFTKEELGLIMHITNLVIHQNDFSECASLVFNALYYKTEIMFNNYKEDKSDE